MSEVVLLVGERAERESLRAVQACNDYIRMGAGRSLEKLLNRYLNDIESGLESPPSKRLSTLREWSAEFGWVARASSYDAIQDTAKTSEIQRLRTEGLAADHERIDELSEIYSKLKIEFLLNGLWYKDVKLSAKGDKVDVEVFNAPLLTQMRGVLDDIAKEVGGRKQKIEHTGANGGPIEHRDVTDLSDDELANIAGRGSRGITEAA